MFRLKLALPLASVESGPKPLNGVHGGVCVFVQLASLTIAIETLAFGTGLLYWSNTCSATGCGKVDPAVANDGGCGVVTDAGSPARMVSEDGVVPVPPDSVPSVAVKHPAG